MLLILGTGPPTVKTCFPRYAYKLTQDGTVRFGTGVFFDFYVMRCRVVL